jgi:hypothetical protein
VPSTAIFATSDHDRLVGLWPFEALDHDQEPEAPGDGAGDGGVHVKGAKVPSPHGVLVVKKRMLLRNTPRYLRLMPLMTHENTP